MKVLYLGNYLNEEIIRERELPFRNAAGSNRMYRLASAFEFCGKSITICSPGTSARVGYSRTFFHKTRIHREKSILVYFAPTIGLPFLSSFFSFLTYPFVVYNLLRKNKFNVVWIYNFNPSLLIIALICRYFLKVPIINNIEDISVPSIKDWQKSTEARPLQQIVFYLSMKGIAYLSNGFIIPTKKFIPFINQKKKPCLNVTGCIDVKLRYSETKYIETQKLNILFAGKIEFEHGIHLLIDFIKLLNNKKGLICLINICGTGEKAEWLKDKLGKLNLSWVKYHGFVSDSTFKKILRDADICVALQNPYGRYGKTKTPSKVYEYLGHGKCVIATDVGDLKYLPKETIIICDSYESEKLFYSLSSLLQKKIKIKNYKEFSYNYAKANFSYSIVGKKIIELIHSVSK